jgi:hypothetical protein
MAVKYNLDSSEEEMNGQFIIILYLVRTYVHAFFIILLINIKLRKKQKLLNRGNMRISA